MSAAESPPQQTRRPTIRAAVILKAGGIENLVVRDLPDPKPGAGEIVIATAFCGCNWGDTMMRNGTYPHPTSYPVVPGWEVAGPVTAVGDGVQHIGIGDRVTLYVPEAGGYAEQTKGSATNAVPLDDRIDLRQAACFTVQGLTAYHMLHTIYGVKAGDTVLVHAAGGGVGLMVVQLAVKAGARVFGTVGSAGKEKRPLEFGAEQVFNLNDGDFVAQVRDLTAGLGVHLTIDSLGASTLDKTYDAVRPMGHVINIGEAEGDPYTNIRERILPKSLTFTRFHLDHVGVGSPVWWQGVDHVLGGLIEGWLKIPIVAEYPLSRAGEMQAHLESRAVSGKLVLSTQA